MEFLRGEFWAQFNFSYICSFCASSLVIIISHCHYNAVLSAVASQKGPGFNYPVGAQPFCVEFGCSPLCFCGPDPLNWCSYSTIHERTEIKVCLQQKEKISIKIYFC